MTLPIKTSSLRNPTTSIDRSYGTNHLERVSGYRVVKTAVPSVFDSGCRIDLIADGEQ